MFEDAGFQIIDDDAPWYCAEGGKGMLVSREEMLHRLRHEEFQVHAAAVAQHHDEEAQLPAGGADADRAPYAPVDLRGLAGRKRQFEEGLAALGPDHAHVVFDRRVTARVAGLAKPLIHLTGAERMGVEQPRHRALEWVEQAGARHRLSGLVVGHGCPGRDGSVMQLQRRGDLCERHVLAIPAVSDLAPDFVGNHGWRSSAACSASMCSRTTARVGMGAGASGAVTATPCAAAGGASSGDG